jgi:hydroxymethylpyrimidine pyrophosphatase-like HAD family hydrolase
LSDNLVGKHKVHKMIFMADDATIQVCPTFVTSGQLHNWCGCLTIAIVWRASHLTIWLRVQRVRPELQRALQGKASMTSTIPGMAEVLPPGASKGDGVGRVLDFLDVDAAEKLAIGDGENDRELLKMAGVTCPCCMRCVTHTTDNECW